MFTNALGERVPPCLSFRGRSQSDVRYLGFPSRLQHEIPSWVKDGALFHIRVRLKKQRSRMLVHPNLAPLLLQSAEFYDSKKRWYITIFLLMPDHVHAILCFERDKAMSDVIADWKRYQTTHHAIEWQDGYFDHRLREDEAGQQIASKLDYIRNNPVVAGLCTAPEDWPWVICRRE